MILVVVLGRELTRRNNIEAAVPDPRLSTELAVASHDVLHLRNDRRFKDREADGDFEN